MLTISYINAYQRVKKLRPCLCLLWKLTTLRKLEFVVIKVRVKYYVQHQVVKI